MSSSYFAPRDWFILTVLVTAFLSPLPVSAQVAQKAALTRPTMPVHGGSLTLKVTDFLAARQSILDASVATGAEVVGGRTFVTEKGRKHGNVLLRSPVDRLPALLPRLRSVGVLYAEDLATAEQISDYEDLGRRVGRLREHETRLDELLRSRRNLRGSDILYIQERLLRTGVDEEQILQQRQDMERRSQTARIMITLFEPPALTERPAVIPLNRFGYWFDKGKRRAEWRRDHLLARLATGTAYLLIYAPLWLPLFLIASRVIWLKRVAIRRIVQKIMELSAQSLRRLRVHEAKPVTGAPEAPVATTGTSTLSN